jgi:NDP-sugar pyrophosphorylase family protein
MMRRGPLPALALLAGGLATRLRPITETVPKSMVSVAGEPFIAHQLRLCAREDIREVVICGGYLCDQIEACVGDGSAFGLQVRYSVDWPQLLGTGGAVRKALPLLGDEFFVMYGDSYLSVSFRAVWNAFRESGRQALMTVFHNRNRWDASNVEFGNGEIVRYDKTARSRQMEHIDYGLGIFRAAVLAAWPADAAFDLAEVYSQLVRERSLAGYNVDRRFYEIGTTTGLAETEAMLARMKAR